MLDYTAPEAARLLGISRQAGYAAVAAGAVPAIRIGRRLLVPKAALNTLLDGPDAKLRTEDRTAG
ncbi:MAG: helix-turn-helix domain-containing protein [Acetobacteraceae bacterium]|nr:helix-turn-helix domain-containing protein [Acetobacteraceae bacterium]